MPVSYAEALPLLLALNGHGPNASSFNKYWQGGGLGYKNVSYNIGPSPPSLTINLMNSQNYTITPAWNTIGIINGSVSDEVVVLGNHRDAWIVGGAGDPNSGSAALNEVVRSFGAALSQGWKPQRTIVFASWDGEEYGLVGSTEWVEQYLPWLSATAVAYLNVDVGTRGTRFNAAAAPVLNKALIEITKEVQSPNQTVPGTSVFDLWDKQIDTMGSGSDFTAFQDFAGIPSLDMGFGGTNVLDPVYHYHSNYDSYAWMAKYGDPSFKYHITATKLWALLAAKLVEEPVIAFNATDYALGLARYLSSVEARAATSTHPVFSSHKPNFAGLEKAIKHLTSTAAKFDTHASHLSALAAATTTSHHHRGAAAVAKLYADVRVVNVLYKHLERAFLYEKGLDSRSWFKHVVFAPGKWTGYAGATFPGMVEAIDEGDERALGKWMGIIEGTVWKAVATLKM